MAFFGAPLIFDFVWYFGVLFIGPWLGTPILKLENWGKEYIPEEDSDIIIFADEYGNPLNYANTSNPKYAGSGGGSDMDNIDSGGNNPLM